MPQDQDDIKGADAMKQAPTPGPLSGDDVKLLVKGDRVRWLCEKDHYGTFVALMDSEGGGIQWHSDYFGRDHYSPRHMIEFVSRPAPPREDLGDGVWADVDTASLAPTAPVEASGSEREAFEQWYCDDAAATVKIKMLSSEIAALREGETYGPKRVALNSKWEAWQARAALGRG